MNSRAKYIIAGLIGVIYISCSGNPGANGSSSNGNKDSSEEHAEIPYRPGLGEFMLELQMHHSKLWFAGINNNWKLANFETGEIKETLEDAKQFASDRPEIKSLPMIYPPIDSIAIAIKNKDGAAFKRDFRLLTNTCNNCHIANRYEFNVITVPVLPPVTNQDFKPQ